MRKMVEESASASCSSIRKSRFVTSLRRKRAPRGRQALPGRIIGWWTPNALGSMRDDDRALAQPFPITRLLRASDGKHISADYGYSYSVVRALDDIG